MSRYENGFPELYDARAEREAAFCDRCMAYHSGPCPCDWCGRVECKCDDEAAS